MLSSFIENMLPMTCNGQSKEKIVLIIKYKIRTYILFCLSLGIIKTFYIFSLSTIHPLNNVFTILVNR